MTYALMHKDGGAIIGPFDSHLDAQGYRASHELSPSHWAVVPMQHPRPNRVIVLRRQAKTPAEGTDRVTPAPGRLAR